MTAFFFFFIVLSWDTGKTNSCLLLSLQQRADNAYPKEKNQAADLPEARTQNNPWLVSPHLSQHSCSSVIILYLRRLAASFYVTMIYLNNVNKIDFLLKIKHDY